MRSVKKGTRVRVLPDGDDDPCLGQFLNDHLVGMSVPTSILLDDGRVVNADYCVWALCSEPIPLSLADDVQYSR